MVQVNDMQSTIPNSESFNWVIGPAAECVHLIVEETRIASLLQHAIIALANQEPLLNIVRQRIKETNNDVTAIDKLILEQRGGLGQWAKELMEEDYAPINRHGIIGMWVAIEVAIEDTVVLILTKDSSSLSMISGAGIKIPKSLSDPLNEIDARRIYNRLEFHSRKGRSVAEGYIYLMSVLNVSFTLPNEFIESISELNYVRNCILHRAGVVDERVHIEAPNLSNQIGEYIKISSKQYLRYYDAVGKFSTELLNGVMKSSYVRNK
jgi:hypothetical protein